MNDSVEASAPTSCTPELVEDLDLIVAVVDDANVHQLRQLIDILVALVLQGRGRSIGGVAALKLGVEIDDLLHRGIGGVTAE